MGGGPSVPNREPSMMPREWSKTCARSTRCYADRPSPNGNPNEGAIECSHSYATNQESCIATLPFAIRARGPMSNYIISGVSTTGSLHSYVHKGTQGYHGV